MKSEKENGMNPIPPEDAFKTFLVMKKPVNILNGQDERNVNFSMDDTKYEIHDQTETVEAKVDVGAHVNFSGQISFFKINYANSNYEGEHEEKCQNQ